MSQAYWIDFVQSTLEQHTCTVDKFGRELALHCEQVNFSTFSGINPSIVRYTTCM